MENIFPLELRLKQISNLSLAEIRLCCSDLLKYDEAWEMLFRRDFPLFTNIKKDFKYWHLKLNVLKKLSKKMGNIWIQYETLAFLHDIYLPLVNEDEFWKTYFDHWIKAQKIISLFYLMVEFYGGKDDSEAIDTMERNIIDRVWIYDIDQVENKMLSKYIYFNNGQMYEKVGETYLWDYFITLISGLEDSGYFTISEDSLIDFGNVNDENSDYLLSVLNTGDKKLLKYSFIINHRWIYNEDEINKAIDYVEKNKYKMKKASRNKYTQNLRDIENKVYKSFN